MNVLSGVTEVLCARTTVIPLTDDSGELQWDPSEVLVLVVTLSLLAGRLLSSCHGPCERV